MTQEFVAAFKTKYGRPPGAIAALTFDAFNVAAAAFKHANSNMKGPLTLALVRTRDLAGATGRLTIVDTGETWKSGIIKQTSDKTASFKARVDRKAPEFGTTAAPTAALPATPQP